MNWQPIETAPKDGTEILICMPGGQSDHYYIVCWSDDFRYWQNRSSENDGLPGVGDLTERDIQSCHLKPMWCHLEPPPTSLCFKP